MKRFAIFVYGIVCYAVFFATFLYAIAFIGDLPDIPRSIDGEPLLPSGQALAIDLLLLTLFAVQHSVMARPAFAVRPGEHRLYPGRHQLRGARPAAGAPRVRRLPAPGAHAAAASARAGAAGNG